VSNNKFFSTEANFDWFLGINISLHLQTTFALATGWGLEGVGLNLDPPGNP